MQKEDLAALKLIEENKLGMIDFTRYSLAVQVTLLHDKQAILKNILAFVLDVHQYPIASIAASVNTGETVLLLTLQFTNQALANVLINFDYLGREGYHKRMELSGSNGLYQFDSAQTNSFSSTFLAVNLYDSLLLDIENDYVGTILEKICWCIQHKKEIHLKGVSL